MRPADVRYSLEANARVRFSSFHSMKESGDYDIFFPYRVNESIERHPNESDYIIRRRDTLES